MLELRDFSLICKIPTKKGYLTPIFSIAKPASIIAQDEIVFDGKP